MSRPTRRQIAEEDARMLRRQADFRVAADAVAAALAPFEEVAAIALFGSVARPLIREVPRFDPFRRHGVEVLHECKDVDLAVWLTGLSRLPALNRARNVAASRLWPDHNVGVPSHQVDIFLIEPATDAYLGRLCDYNQCPKGKRACEAPDCGRVSHLQQHEDFRFDPAALGADRAIRLYERGSGWLAKAAALPSAEAEPPPPPADLEGSGRGLWGADSAATVKKLRREWPS